MHAKKQVMPSSACIGQWCVTTTILFLTKTSFWPYTLEWCTWSCFVLLWNDLSCITFFLASMHFNKSYRHPFSLLAPESTRRSRAYTLPGPYGTQRCTSRLRHSPLHQTPTKGPGFSQEQKKKLSPSYHHCFVTVRIVVGAQPCIYTSLLSLWPNASALLPRW